LDDRAPRHDWSDHIVGVVEEFVRLGAELCGFDAVVQSDLPIGAGLASSAALAVATARALRGAFDFVMGDRGVAELAHRSEVDFVGARVGTMDQLVCSLGRWGEALLIDTRNASTRPIALGKLDAEIVILDSGLRHEHARGTYGVRRAECEEAARILGVASLRDVRAEVGTLPGPLARRVRHVVSENLRVEAAVAAIDNRDAQALGEVLDRGHVSLRDDYEVSLPAIDEIVETAQRDSDTYGARLIGGGFGGCVLVLAKRGAGRVVADRIATTTGVRLLAILPA
jgi:galactokinase